MNDHVRQFHSAGNGWSEPFELWETCTCGVTTWAYRQFHAENREDPDSNWRNHIDWVACGGGVGNEHEHCG